MMRAQKLPVHPNPHSGFALATVLVVLLVLAFVVAALLGNQTLAVRETSSVLTSATRAAESHNIHRMCLRNLRQQMTQSALNTGATVDLSAVQTLTIKDGINPTINGSCQIEIDAPTTPTAWTPQLRISSTVGTQTEVSEWRYAPCSASSSCFSAQTRLIFGQIGASNTPVTVVPEFIPNQPVQTAWRIQ